jgi:hypothetical protein
MHSEADNALSQHIIWTGLRSAKFRDLSVFCAMPTTPISADTAIPP